MTQGKIQVVQQFMGDNLSWMVTISGQNKSLTSGWFGLSQLVRGALSSSLVSLSSPAVFVIVA